MNSEQKKLKKSEMNSSMAGSVSSLQHRSLINTFRTVTWAIASTRQCSCRPLRRKLSTSDVPPANGQASDCSHSIRRPHGYSDVKQLQCHVLHSHSDNTSTAAMSHTATVLITPTAAVSYTATVLMTSTAAVSCLIQPQCWWHQQLQCRTQPQCWWHQQLQCLTQPQCWWHQQGQCCCCSDQRRPTPQRCGPGRNHCC